MRRALTEAEKKSVSDIAAQLLVQSYRQQNPGTSNDPEGGPEEQLAEAEDDAVIVNHVKQLLNEVIDAVVTNSDLENENTQVQSQSMNTNNYNNNESSDSGSNVQISSTFKNNTHLIISENGKTTTFILNTPDDATSQNQKMSSSSSSSSVTSNVMNFKNMTHDIKDDNGNKTITILQSGQDEETSSQPSTSTTTTTTTTTTTSTTTTTTATSSSTTTRRMTTTSVTTKQTTKRTTPAPPPTTTTPTPTLLQAMAQQVGVALGTFTNLGSGFNALTSPIYLLLSGKRKRSLEQVLPPEDSHFLQNLYSLRMKNENKKSD